MKRRIPKDAPDPIDRHVGTRVRARRVGLRVSQTRLGKAIGVTFQQIQKYENGANRIGASNLYKIAKALGVEVTFFYGGLEDALGAAPARSGSGHAEGRQAPFEVDPLSSKEAINLMHNSFRIPDPEVRKRLFNFVKSVAGSGDQE